MPIGLGCVEGASNLELPLVKFTSDLGYKLFILMYVVAVLCYYQVILYRTFDGLSKLVFCAALLPVGGDVTVSLGCV